MSFGVACALACGVMTLGCSEDAAEAESWTIASPAFDAGAEIPKEHTCDGRGFAEGSSPPLSWTEGPAGTKSYAIVLKHLAIVESVDPSSPDYPKGFMWVIWDIPASARSLPANLGRAALLPEVPGAQQWAIRNQFGYFAPCPNADPAVTTHVTDRYAFTLYALNTEKLALPAKEANVANYALTLTKQLDAVNIGTTELRAVSSAVAGTAPTPVDMTTLVYPVPVP
jgi:phosphatidylethanolamine-binding protein (PEBP) family uncharacterized protein